MKRFGILALLLLLAAHPAHAQTSCSVLSQSQLLNSFADTAPAGSISPRNMRDFVCSSALLSSGTQTSGDGAMFLNSGSGVTLQDASNGMPVFPLGVNLSGGTLTLSGTAAAPSNSQIYSVLNEVNGTYSGFGPTALYNFKVNNWDVNRTGNGVPEFMSLAAVLGGPNQQGGSIMFGVSLDLHTPPGDTTNQFYQGAEFSSLAEVNAGGNSTTAAGSNFAFAAASKLTTGATYWFGVVGAEFDVAIETGASALSKIGLNIISAPDDAVQATQFSTAFSVGSASVTDSLGGSGPGWNSALSIGGPNGYDGVSMAGSIITCTPHQGAMKCGTHAHGIDLSSFTAFTVDAFASPNFQVLPNGNINMFNTLTAPGNIWTVTALGAATHTFTIGDTTAHNAIQFLEGLTGGVTTIREVGVDTNQILSIQSAGNGLMRLGNSVDGTAVQLNDAGGVVADNLAITPHVAGFNAVTITATGSDTDVSLSLGTKVAGKVSPPATASFGAYMITPGSVAGVSCATGTLTPATTVVTGGIVTHC